MVLTSTRFTRLCHVVQWKTPSAVCVWVGGGEDRAYMCVSEGYIYCVLCLGAYTDPQQAQLTLFNDFPACPSAILDPH